MVLREHQAAKQSGLPPEYISGREAAVCKGCWSAIGAGDLPQSQLPGLLDFAPAFEEFQLFARGRRQ